MHIKFSKLVNFFTAFRHDIGNESKWIFLSVSIFPQIISIILKHFVPKSLNYHQIKRHLIHTITLIEPGQTSKSFIWFLSILAFEHWVMHCMKSFRIRSFPGPYFPTFGLNTDKYGVSLHEYGQIRSISPYLVRVGDNTD